MRYLVVLLLFAMGCTQRYHHSAEAPGKLVSINLVDENGMSETISNPDRLKEYERVNFLSNQPYAKVMRVFARDRQGNTRTCLTSYHKNGQPKQYLEAVNNRAQGQYYEWHPEGTLKIEATVVGGDGDLAPSSEKTWLFDGIVRVWDANHNLDASISYVKGELHGPSLYYHASGKIWKRVPYTKNKIHGKLEIFLESGGLFQSMEYVNGLQHGKSLKFWSPDLIAAEEHYRNDLLSWGRYYQITGELISEINDGVGERALFGKQSVCELQEYKNGVLEGKVQTFSEDGHLLTVCHYKNSAKHGEELEYYPPNPFNPKARPMLSIYWSEGKIHGAVKTWYENGVLESQREIAKNLKTGLSTAWYRDGSLMLIEEYDLDKLLKGDYFKKGEKYPVSEVVDGKGTATIYDGDGNFVHRIAYHKGLPDD